METGISFLDVGISYFQQGLGFVRDTLISISSYIPGVNSSLSVTVLFLLFSLFVGNMITKKFVTQPFSMTYIMYTIIITISIFLNLILLG